LPSIQKEQRSVEQETEAEQIHIYKPDMSYRVRAALMLVDWEKVRLVTFGHHNITVITEVGSRTFEFKSNIETKIAFEDWASVPNARADLCLENKLLRTIS
jgi:hypothetical protein